MEPTRFKALMARVPAPVTVVATRSEGRPCGATVSSFASLSLDPPLISIALINGTTLLEQIRAERRFAVNLLGQRQAEIALAFAGPAETRFDGVSWSWQDDLPRLNGVASYIECDLHQEIAGGDHALLFGLVRSCDVSDEPPLVYTARKFGTHSKLVADREHSIADKIRAFAT